MNDFKEISALSFAIMSLIFAIFGGVVMSCMLICVAMLFIDTDREKTNDD